MSGWKDSELAEIGAADELEITSFRNDGTARPYVIIWVVRVGDDLYVRSWKGRSGGWFRRALQRREGRIRASGIERDVTLDEPDDAVHPAIDDAYRTKYGRYPEAYVQPMVEPDAIAATFRLVPQRGDRLGAASAPTRWQENHQRTQWPASRLTFYAKASANSTSELREVLPAAWVRPMVYSQR
jgi:hypothetical protein